jgi:hypothetical protein
VDVVGWRKFDDRPGKILFLVQCAAGENWKNKDRIPLERWKRWIFFASRPLEVLAFPEVYSIRTSIEGKSWLEFHEGRVIMDRLRIAVFDSRKVPTDLKLQLSNWCGEQFGKLRARP